MVELTETELLRQRLADAEAKVKQRESEVGDLIAALAICEEQLATARDDFRHLKQLAKKVEVELAKFYECSESNGCYDDCGRVHIRDAEGLSFVHSSANETMRTVYHRFGE